MVKGSGGGVIRRATALVIGLTLWVDFSRDQRHGPHENGSRYLTAFAPELARRRRAATRLGGMSRVERDDEGDDCGGQ